MAISRRWTPPSSSIVLVVRRHHPSSSATSNDLGHKLVDHLAGPSAHLTHRRRCPELTSEAWKTSITSPSAIFSSLCSCYPSPDGHLSPSSTHASQPYTAYRLTAPPWNGFLQLGILKHDHEHVPYFPTKNCSISSSTWYGSLFFNCTYCMVPRRNWGGLSLSLSDFLLVLHGRILPRLTPCYGALQVGVVLLLLLTVFEHRTPLRKPLSRPSASNHKFLSNSSWGARQSQWCPNSGTNLANFLRYGFWENEFEVWIYHPLWRLWPTWPWVFNDIPTKFQHSSYLIGSEDEHSRKLWKT